MLDLEAVLALRAVATGGSVAVAAETLGYTPSAVSQQIKRLERGTGVTLLERAGRGVVLTDAGRQLVTTSAPVLADLERIEADLQLARSVAAEQVTGEVRVAAFSTAVRGLLVEVLAGLRREHPALRVPLRESEPWETVALVASGQRDLGIVHAWGGVALALNKSARHCASFSTPISTSCRSNRAARNSPLAVTTVFEATKLARRAYSVSSFA